VNRTSILHLNGERTERPRRGGKQRIKSSR
jgi:hypothetical protein